MDGRKISQEHSETESAVAERAAALTFAPHPCFAVDTGSRAEHLKVALDLRIHPRAIHLHLRQGERIANNLLRESLHISTLVRRDAPAIGRRRAHRNEPEPGVCGAEGKVHRGATLVWTHGVTGLKHWPRFALSRYKVPNH